MTLMVRCFLQQNDDVAEDKETAPIAWDFASPHVGWS